MASSTASLVTALNTTRSTGMPARSLLAVEHLEDMPGDGLALAVGVGGEDQLARPFERFGDLVEPFGRLGLDVPMHLEVLVRLDRAVLGGQVAHMAIGGEHAVVRAPDTC